MGRIADNREMNQSVTAAMHARIRRILIVDDHVHICRSMAAVLARHGIAVDAAENGQVGLDKFIAEPGKYGVIFMDLHMPVMDGYEAARRIREVGEEGDRVLIIAMSGDAFMEECPFFDYRLEKPFEMERLVPIIGQAMGRPSGNAAQPDR